MREKRFTECLEVVQLVYLQRTLQIPENSVEIRRLGMDALPFILENYHHPNAKSDYLTARIKELMLGAYLDGDLVGFAGIHEEGAMGLLEVLPAFRGRGIGRTLFAALIRYQLERGSIPYSHAVMGNEVSMKLQCSLGMRPCAQSLFWLYKPVQFPRNAD